MHLVERRLNAARRLRASLARQLYVAELLRRGEGGAQELRGAVEGHQGDAQPRRENARNAHPVWGRIVGRAAEKPPPLFSGWMLVGQGRSPGFGGDLKKNAPALWAGIWRVGKGKKQGALGKSQVFRELDLLKRGSQAFLGLLCAGRSFHYVLDRKGLRAPHVSYTSTGSPSLLVATSPIYPPRRPPQKDVFTSAKICSSPSPSYSPPASSPIPLPHLLLSPTASAP